MCALGRGREAKGAATRAQSQQESTTHSTAGSFKGKVAEVQNTGQHASQARASPNLSRERNPERSLYTRALPAQFAVFISRGLFWLAPTCSRYYREEEEDNSRRCKLAADTRAASPWHVAAVLFVVMDHDHCTRWSLGVTSASTSCLLVKKRR